MSQRAIPTTDRISTLPDAVLCHILSFLPTKAAAATSILSKRWIRLWLLVPIFDFDDRSYVQSKETYSRRFNKSVYAAILSRDVHQPIKTFRLKCLSPSHFDDPSDVNIWVNAVLQRRVEHLELFMPCHWLGASSIKLPLPSGILTCRTLVVLKMKMLYVKAFLCVDLPSLKILHLDFVRFLERRYLAELIFGCPILEDLQAKNLEFSNILSGAEFESLPQLVRADISYPDFPLKAINNVKFLRLDKIYWIGIGYRINPCAEDIIPMFQNLAHIELISIDYPIWHEVVEVLKHCPKLQILVIEKKSSDFLPEMENLGEDWPYPQSVPKCILLHLRSCRLNNYKGSKGEFRFAEYIMQNARLLHTMTICSASASNLPEKFKMLKKLSLCRRCSATCQLSFN